MASWDYRNTFVNRSWNLPTSRSGRQRTFGFWLRETIDRPIANTGSGAAPWSTDIYHPLKDGEIRVLTVNPGLDAEPLVGSFDVVKPQLDSCYQALSYVWGIASFQESDYLSGISIETSEGVSGLNLTTNLERALVGLRSSTESVRLWVDAICINQQDLEERAQQVTLMTDIYREAEGVLVWLGRETEHSLLGMMMLEDMCRGKLVEHESSWLELPLEVLLPALRDILERPYFKRLWVVQEAALARFITMICGQSRFTWKSTAATVVSFVRHFKMAAMSPRWVDAGLGKVELADFLQLLERQLTNGPDAQKWARRTRRPDLLSSAYLLRNRQASDPRDRIYSLLGLVDEQTALELRPDYSLPVEDLFARFRQVMIRQTEEICAELAEMDDVGEKRDVHLQLRDIAGKATILEQQEEPVDEFLMAAEFQCLTAIRRMRAGNLEQASRLLGRASILLHSELEHRVPCVERSCRLTDQAVKKEAP